MTQFEQWLIAWAHLIDSAVAILTLAIVRPSLGISVTIWSLSRRGKQEALREAKE